MLAELDRRQHTTPRIVHDCRDRQKEQRRDLLSGHQLIKRVRERFAVSDIACPASVRGVLHR